MKKILTYISVLAAVAFNATSCVDQIFPKGSDPTPVLAASGVDITISDVEDESFTYTIAPKEEGLYYSYLVCEGEAEVLDSVALYKGKYSGEDGKVVKYKDANTTTVTLKNLKPFTKYTVYAVNSSKEGNVGKVYSKTVQTSDNVPPTWAEPCDFDENEVTITFSEDVTYVKENKITATVFCKLYVTGNPFRAPVEAAEVTVDANKVTFSFPDLTIPGTYYAIQWPAGTFVDAAGNQCDELESKFLSAVGETQDDYDADGLTGYLENGDLEYEVPAPSEISSWNSWIAVHVPNGVQRVDLEDGYYTTVYHVDQDGTTTITAVPMKKAYNYYGTYYDVNVKVSGQDIAQAGDQLSITIPAGAVMDWFGNVNEDDISVLTPLCPYQLKDFFGRFTVRSTSAYDGTNYTDTFDLMPSDNDDYNVKVTGTLAGLAFTMYANAYPDEGCIEFPFQQIATYGSIYDIYLTLAAGSSYYDDYSLGWDLVATHTFEDWYAPYGMCWGLLAYYGGNPYAFMEQTIISSITYVGEVPEAAPGSVKAGTSLSMKDGKAVRATDKPAKVRR